jgi:hypothetical protein
LFLDPIVAEETDEECVFLKPDSSDHVRRNRRIGNHVARFGCIVEVLGVPFKIDKRIVSEPHEPRLGDDITLFSNSSPLEAIKLIAFRMSKVRYFLGRDSGGTNPLMR